MPMNKTPNHQKKNKTRTVTAPKQGWTRDEVGNIICAVMICAVSLSVLLLTLAVFVSAVKMK
jgi:hypothetical protein